MEERERKGGYTKTREKQREREIRELKKINRKG